MRAKKRKTILLAAALLLPLLAWLMPPQTVRAGTTPYRYCFDDLNGGTGVGSDKLSVLDGWELEAGETLHFAGWLAVEGGVASYEYAFVNSESAGSMEWTRPQTKIVARDDLKKANIDYTSGHSTAGFDLTLQAPSGADGYYDFYLRGIAESGDKCDLLVVLGVRVGQPDTDGDETYTISLSRLAAENGASPGVTFTKSGAVTLTSEGVLRLGRFNLAAFDKVSLTYTAGKSFTATDGDRAAALGLKLVAEGADPPSPYYRDGLYDMQNSRVLGRLTRGTGEQTLEIDLSDVDDWGDLYLSAYLFGADTVTVQAVTFTYKGKADTRTAARIFCSGDLSGYFSSFNRVSATTETDSALGDVLRIRATEDTNDPYVYFNAESLLKGYGIRLNADEYRYMVVLARARSGNQNTNMCFYLCAGDISSPTEQCTISRTLQADGAWHYYLLDLSDKATWAGVIHGWRFDMINARAASGDYVDYASVQFFRTREAAVAVASGDPLHPDAVYHAGDPLVLRDDREEISAAPIFGNFSPAEADTYRPPETEPTTEPVTEPAAEPATEPATEPVTEPVTEPSTDPATEPVTEPATEPVTEPVTEPATEPATDPGTEPVTEFTTDSITDPATDPATDTDPEPATAPAVNTDPEPVTEPITDPATETAATATDATESTADAGDSASGGASGGCRSELAGSMPMLLILACVAISCRAGVNRARRH